MTGYQTDSAERQAALRRKVEGADGPESKVPEHPLLTLQSQIGNAQVARLLAQRAAEEDENLQAKHDLSVQRAGDEDELAAKHDLAQREMSEESEQVGIDGGAVGPDTAQRIQSSRGGGSSLVSSTRPWQKG